MRMTMSMSMRMMRTRVRVTMKVKVRVRVRLRVSLKMGIMTKMMSSVHTPRAADYSDRTKKGKEREVGRGRGRRNGGEERERRVWNVIHDVL